VAKLTGDLYDLETTLDAKAEETGIRDRYAYEKWPRKFEQAVKWSFLSKSEPNYRELKWGQA